MKRALSIKPQRRKRKEVEWGNMRVMKWTRENWGVPYSRDFWDIPELREVKRYGS